MNALLHRRRLTRWLLCYGIVPFHTLPGHHLCLWSCLCHVLLSCPTIVSCHAMWCLCRFHAVSCPCFKGPTIEVGGDQVRSVTGRPTQVFDSLLQIAHVHVLATRWRWCYSFERRLFLPLNRGDGILTHSWRMPLALCTRDVSVTQDVYT